MLLLTWGQHLAPVAPHPHPLAFDYAVATVPPRWATIGRIVMGQTLALLALALVLVLVLVLALVLMHILVLALVLMHILDLALVLMHILDLALVLVKKVRKRAQTMILRKGVVGVVEDASRGHRRVGMRVLALVPGALALALVPGATFD